MSNAAGSGKGSEGAAKAAAEALGDLDLAGEVASLKADIARLAARLEEKTTSARSRLREGLAGEIDELGARLTDLAEQVMRQGRGAAESAGVEVNAQVERAREAVQRNPFIGIAVAAAMGFLMGLVARSSR